GRLSLLGAKNRVEVERILQDRAKQFKIKVHSRVNVGNHLHIVASFPNSELFKNFLRTVTCLIARVVTGAKKGKPFGKRFWDHLAFTRVVNGSRDFFGLMKYLERNRIEAENGRLARRTVEEYNKAARVAEKTGRDIWQILNTG